MVTEVAASTPCAMAREKQSAAAVRISWNSAGGTAALPGDAEQDSPKIVSPSYMEWAGLIARASPSCADPASRPHCALVSGTLVATTPIVVFSDDCRPASTAAPAARSAADGGRSQSNSPGRPYPAAYSVPSLGETTEPTAFTAASAATTVPSGSTTLADPMPPFSPPVTAPVPAPTHPWLTPGAATSAASNAVAPHAASG